MKNPKSFSSISPVLALLMVAALALVVPVARAQQNTASAVDRGYRTGYSDGYQAGFRDFNEHAPRDFSNNEDFRSADRAYVASYGPIEDYKDGYKQGFEAGYAAGFDQKAFDSAIPGNLHRRDGGADSQAGAGGSGATGSGLRNLPARSILRVELLSEISTDVSQRGDPFQVRVLEPADLAGLAIQGHIARLKRPGKVKGDAELQLAFDRLIVNGNPVPFDAQVIEVIEQGVRETGSVDPEGGVKGRDSTKDDVAKVGAGTAVGAIIGAIAGGGKGAAIGAAIGGGAATGGVLATRGKDLRLHSGQQLRIQTATETSF